MEPIQGAHMRRLLAAVSTLIVVACSGGGNDDPPPPPTGSITLSNQSGESIDEVYIALPTDQVWGAQRNGGVVPYQFSFTQSGLTPTDWHVKAVSHGSSSYYAFALFVPVAAGQDIGVTLYDDDFSGTLFVRNADSLARDITHLWVKPSADPVEAFQPVDLAAPLMPGSAQEIVAITAGSWDVWCDFDDGTDDAVYGVALSPFSDSAVTCAGP